MIRQLHGRAVRWLAPRTLKVEIVKLSVARRALAAEADVVSLGTEVATSTEAAQSASARTRLKVDTSAPVCRGEELQPLYVDGHGAPTTPPDVGPTHPEG